MSRDDAASICYLADPVTTPRITTYAVRRGRGFVAVHVHPSGQCYADTNEGERMRSGTLQIFVEGTDASTIRELSLLPNVLRYRSLAELRRSVIAEVVRSPSTDAASRQWPRGGGNRER